MQRGSGSGSSAPNPQKVLPKALTLLPIETLIPKLREERNAAEDEKLPCVLKLCFSVLMTQVINEPTRDPIEKKIARLTCHRRMG